MFRSPMFQCVKHASMREGASRPHTHIRGALPFPPSLHSPASRLLRRAQTTSNPRSPLTMLNHHGAHGALEGDRWQPQPPHPSPPRVRGMFLPMFRDFRTILGIFTIH